MQWRRFADRLGRVAGRDAGGGSLAARRADCLQCGSDRVDVLRVDRRRVRLSCRACRAVVSTGQLGLVRPADSGGAGEASGGPAARPSPDPLAALAPYVSPMLAAWLRPPEGKAPPNVRLDKASIYRIWKEFDRFLADARRSLPSASDHGQVPPSGRGRPGAAAAERYAALAAEVGERDQPPATPLPSFGEVAGQLQNLCYDEPAVVAVLSTSSKTARVDDPAWGAALVQRVACARRWLATPGREHCWIETSSDGPADPAATRRLVEQEALDRRLDPSERQALFAAVFGTTGGPPTHCLLDSYRPEVLLAALEAHQRDGSHPLRAAVLAALERGALRAEAGSEAPPGDAGASTVGSP